MHSSSVRTHACRCAPECMCVCERECVCAHARTHRCTRTCTIGLPLYKPHAHVHAHVPGPPRTHLLTRSVPTRPKFHDSCCRAFPTAFQLHVRQSGHPPASTPTSTPACISIPTPTPSPTPRTLAPNLIIRYRHRDRSPHIFVIPSQGLPLCRITALWHPRLPP